MRFLVDNFKKLPDEKRLIKYLFEKVSHDYPTTAIIKEAIVDSNIVEVAYNASTGVLTATINPTIAGSFLDILIEATYPNGEKIQWLQTIETLIVGDYPYEVPPVPPDENLIILYYADGITQFGFMQLPTTITLESPQYPTGV